MTCVIYVNWYLHMLRSIMIIHTYFHLYNSIEIIIYKLMFIITFLHHNWHEIAYIEGLTNYILLLVYRTYMYILHNISTFYGIVQTDIMIHKFIIVKYFLANTWNYMSYREQVRSYMLLTEHCTRTCCDYSSQAFTVYTFSHVKYLHSLLSRITCLHDDVKVYV